MNINWIIDYLNTRKQTSSNNSNALDFSLDYIDEIKSHLNKDLETQFDKLLDRAVLVGEVNLIIDLLRLINRYYLEQTSETPNE